MCALAVEQTRFVSRAVRSAIWYPLMDPLLQIIDLSLDLGEVSRAPERNTTLVPPADGVTKGSYSRDEREEAVKYAEESSCLRLDHVLGKFEFVHERVASCVQRIVQAGDGAGVVMVDDEFQNDPTEGGVIQCTGFVSEHLFDGL